MLSTTGIPGFDEIVPEGLTAGKTTFSLQFIAEGIKRGERCLYVAVGGAGEDLGALAKATGIFLDPELVTLHTVHISADILEGPEQRICASPAESVGSLWLRQIPKHMILRYFYDLKAFEAAGFFRSHFGFVVEAFHSAQGNLFFGLEPVE